MEDQKYKKKFKSYVNQKKSYHASLQAGLTGFLCTCNFKEKESIKDACKLLETFNENEFIKVSVNENEKVYSNDTCDTEDINQYSLRNENENHNDISDTLKEEIEKLNENSGSSIAKPEFQQVDTGIKNVIFIKSSVSDPLKLALSIIHKASVSELPMSRFLMRFIPIQVVCKASINDIKLKAKELFEKYFVLVPVTFGIVFDRHYNNSIQRQDVIELLASIVMEKNPQNKVDLKNPNISIIVTVIKNLCLLSIAPDYFKYKKYNLLELCNRK